MITAHMGGKKKMTHIKPIKKIKLIAARHLKCSPMPSLLRCTIQIR